MIPVLIIWLLRRFGQRRYTSRIAQNDFEWRIVSIVLLILMLLITVNNYAQNKQLSYQIVRNGNKVGTLNFSETKNGVMDYLKMVSDVKARFIFTITAHASEEAVYRNGVLMQSSIYRKLNGNEKVNKQHSAENNQYVIRAGNNTQVIKSYPITYNMLSLYSKEPENVSKVYSDNFETFLAIQKIEAHKYKIAMPDGNYSCYSYDEGVLNLIEVHHSLYSANILLAKN